MNLLINKYCILLIMFFSCIIAVSAQQGNEQENQRRLYLNISYFLPHNNIPYLVVSTKTKEERKFIPLENMNTALYMNEETDSALIGKNKTNEKGESKFFLPATLKYAWDSADTINFIAVMEANKEFESDRTELAITKARLEIDTFSAEETKHIIVTAREFKNGEWKAVPDVEVKISVGQLLGNLPVSEEAYYTTEDDGSVTAEFTRDSLPGDNKGNLVLIARTEENEVFGNIFTEMTVNWGVVPEPENLLHKRSLWATRFKTPYWLLGLAYTITGGVWAVLIYLFIQLLRIRRLGKIADRS